MENKISKNTFGIINLITNLNNSIGPIKILVDRFFN